MNFIEIELTDEQLENVSGGFTQHESLLGARATGKRGTRSAAEATSAPSWTLGMVARTPPVVLGPLVCF